MSYTGTLWFTGRIKNGIVQQTKIFNNHFYERSSVKKIIIPCLIACALTAHNNTFSMLARAVRANTPHSRTTWNVPYHRNKICPEAYDPTNLNSILRQNRQLTKKIDQQNSIVKEILVLKKQNYYQPSAHLMHEINYLTNQFDELEEKIRS
jgi:hypothetical protein